MKDNRSRLELERLIIEAVRGTNMMLVRKILVERYRVDQFKKLTYDQILDFVNYLYENGPI